MDILYEDEWLLIVNKPTGLLTIQDGYSSDLPHVRTLLEPKFGRCWIVHRLDKETSGILVLARSKEVHRSLSLLFQKREIRKSYQAIVYGKPKFFFLNITEPLKVNGDRSHRTVVDQIKGKPALTKISLVSSNGLLSVVNAQPYTGYTHQIRAHLYFIGHPILGDPLYFDKHLKEYQHYSALTPRLALHSQMIEFLHPVTQSQLSILAPYPEDYRLMLELIK
jgi:tRNA pseudouridine32 synthase/23S rRNA pseudouridine746 synthase